MKRYIILVLFLFIYPFCEEDISPADDDTIQEENSISEIKVTPSNGALQIGQSLQFIATGYYESGSTVNLTSICEWNSSDSSVAEIDSKGLATAKGYGITEITASYMGITSPPATLTVGSIDSPRVEIYGFDPMDMLIFSGDIEVPYSIYDEQKDAVSIKVEYSIDGASTWRRASRADNSEGTTDLSSGTTAEGGVRHTFIWASGRDFPGSFHLDVAIRITPTDSSGNEGEPAQTEIWDYYGDGTILIGIMVNNLEGDSSDIYIDNLSNFTELTFGIDAIYDIFYAYFEFIHQGMNYMGYILFEECMPGIYSMKDDDYPYFYIYQEPVITSGYLTGYRRVFLDTEGVLEMESCSPPTLILGPSEHEVHLQDIYEDLDANVMVYPPDELRGTLFIYDGELRD